MQGLTPFRCAFAAAVVVALMTPMYSAYKGHADDRDVEAVLTAYPTLKGSPADSCATCHLGGDVRDPMPAGAVRSENHCDYCHVVVVRGKRDVRETLNRFGAAYLAAGRGAPAVRALAAKDSDGDGFPNDAELKGGTNPGDAASNPSVPLAPFRIYMASALRNLSPIVAQTVFVNSTKGRSGDSYSQYRGNAVWEMLRAIGVLDTATSVDLLAADGYEHTFTVDELKKSWPQDAPVTGLSTKDLGPCGWVTYGSPTLDPDKPLPAARIILAFEENGRPFDKARLDPDTGRIVGKGPLRSVAPQFRLSPPDLSQSADTSCAAGVAEAYRFHEDYDHNAGAAVSAIVGVRVKPLPKGTRDVDWQTPAARYLADEQILFFGALKAGESK
jgi:hypothetical protein